MKKILLIAALLNVGYIVKAQNTSPENRIVVLGESQINIPADIVNFTITLRGEDSTSIENAYKKHKEQETKILQIIKELNIPATNINYSLMSIGKERKYIATYNNNKEVDYFVSNQTVTFKLNNIKNYSEAQTKLIKANFPSFYSNFESSELNKRKKEVLEKAVVVAKEKANTLATIAERKIKRIVKVADTEDTDPQFNNFHRSLEFKTMAAAADGNGGLIDIPQTIQISATVKVVFELE